MDAAFGPGKQHPVGVQHQFRDLLLAGPTASDGGDELFITVAAQIDAPIVEVVIPAQVVPPDHSGIVKLQALCRVDTAYLVQIFLFFSYIPSVLFFFRLWIPWLLKITRELCDLDVLVPRIVGPFPAKGRIPFHMAAR